MAHEDFETAIERQLQGALDATETATLRQHLDGCASCRDYEAAARNQNERMENMFRQTTTTTTMDVKAIGERAQAMLRAQRRGLWLVPLAAVFVPTVLTASEMVTNPAHWPLRLLSLALFATFGAVVLVYAQRVELRKSEWRLATQGGLQFYRDRLDQQIRVQRTARWAPILMPLFILTAWQQQTLDAKIMCTLTAVLLPVLALHSYFVRLPRLLRERAELG